MVMDREDATDATRSQASRAPAAAAATAATDEIVLLPGTLEAQPGRADRQSGEVHAGIDASVLHSCEQAFDFETVQGAHPVLRRRWPTPTSPTDQPRLPSTSPFPPSSSFSNSTRPDAMAKVQWGKFSMVIVGSQSLSHSILGREARGSSSSTPVLSSCEANLTSSFPCYRWSVTALGYGVMSCPSLSALAPRSIHRMREGLCS